MKSFAFLRKKCWENYSVNSQYPKYIIPLDHKSPEKELSCEGHVEIARKWDYVKNNYSIEKSKRVRKM